MQSPNHSITQSPNRVQLLHTCLVNEFTPRAGVAVVRVLERLGFTVEVPLDQTCCGQPAFNAGFHDEARAAARHTVGVLDATEGPIVIPSGSCGDMVIHQYASLFERDDEGREQAARVAGRCREFSAFVAAHLPDGALGARVEACVAYHPSCHLLRGLGIDREPRALIDAVPGVRQAPVAAQDECCGFGGLFSIKHADISARMLERKLDHLAASGATRVVSCDAGCLLHIGGGVHRRKLALQVQHLAELVDEAMA
jgi:L-lactate dehydrogenase complex protein LldE